jgi:hypothetical protein
MQGVDPWASGTSWGGEVGLYVSPLGVGKISLVCTFHVRHLTEPLPHNPPSDGFRRVFCEVGVGLGHRSALRRPPQLATMVP